MEDEQVLASDGVTYVVRIGHTVRRPVRPFTATIQAYLQHLHDRDFHDAPLPLGYDVEGREVLSFVAGDVPQEPLPDFACTDDVLPPLATLIRRLHDAAADFVEPPDAVWGGIPGTPTGVVPLFEKPELVSHQDYCPGNVVFRDGLPAAFIDFDLSRPTTRVADLVNAIYWWTPLTHPNDRPPALRDADVPARVRIVADAYGLTQEQRARGADRAAASRELVAGHARRGAGRSSVCRLVGRRPRAEVAAFAGLAGPRGRPHRRRFALTDPGVADPRFASLRVVSTPDLSASNSHQGCEVAVGLAWATSGRAFNC
jgi:Phosphotransferase enzyme family